jgi:hypothetical protein
MNGTPTLTYVSHERNLGWSSLREQKDHGAVVVLVGVTPDQGVEESFIQGEAPQGVPYEKRMLARDAPENIREHMGNWRAVCI